MRDVIEASYEGLVWLARMASPLMAPFNDKLRRGLTGRRGAVTRIAAWAARHRQRDLPLVWMHAPSVGEALMAQAILSSLRRQVPDCQVLFTYFSPSAERIAPQVGADVWDYLPWDLTGEVRSCLAALEPTVVAFVRTEIWPVLVRESARRGVPTALLNGVLGPASSRLRRPARTLLGSAYRRLSTVGAVAEADGRRFVQLGATPARVHVAGDARFDQVLERVQALDRAQPLLARLRASDVPVLLAGSTWPADEARLLQAVAAVRERRGVRLVVAPHEPTPNHLSGLEAALQQLGIEHRRLSAVEGAGDDPLPPAIVVDRVGVLADLYAAASLAYVGGGFGRQGLHSVVEPAALGVPVLFGPHHGNAREAAELAAAGGGLVVADAAALTAQLERLLSDPEARRATGEAAGRFVQEHSGGAERNARLLERLLRQREKGGDP